jgi:hypothetical protein
MITEIMAREVSKNKNCFAFIDYRIPIKVRRICSSRNVDTCA